MEQQQSDRPPSGQEEHESFSPRSSLLRSTSTESPVPPHERESITKVPVTPGISLDTYDSRPTSRDVPSERTESPSYFRGQSSEVVSSPTQLEGATQPPGEVSKGSRSGHDILRRLSLAAMRGRRESLTDIRSGVPDLALSGNIISATFNIPHSLKYQQGQDWVSCHAQASRKSPCVAHAVQQPQADNLTDSWGSPWTVCPLRLFLLPVLR
jgi:trehalose 6-phosphate synthase/phosphatase